MKMKAFALASLMIFSVSVAPANANTSVIWDVFGSTYTKASFSFVTQPIVVSPTEVRKYSYAILPACETLNNLKLNTSDCLEKIEASINGVDWVEGKFDSYIPVGHQVTDVGPLLTPRWPIGDIELKAGTLNNNIQGSRSSLWKFPGIGQSNSDQFLVSYQVGAPVYNDQVNYTEAITELNIQPVAVTETGTKPAVDDGKQISTNTLNGQECFANPTYKYCIHFFPFASEKIKFRLTANLKVAEKSLTSSTWIYAHATKADIVQKLSSDSINGQEVIFEASPVAIEIPTIVMKTISDVAAYVDAMYPPNPIAISTDQGKKDYEKTRNAQIAMYSKGVESGLNNYQYVEQQNSFADWSTYVMGKQDPFIKVEDTREYLGLQFKTLPSGSAVLNSELSKVVSNCPANGKVAGIISSNASALETSPPALDRNSMTLKYRVAAPHLKANGELNTGFYKLQLSPTMAKCIWGQNLVGAKAEVSILNDSGQTQIASSTFNFTNESANFEISGFHYSAGSINLKLVLPKQEVASTSTPSPSPSQSPPKNDVKKVLSILCYKGKVTKKITGTNPKCPVGFKAKKV